MVRQIELIDGPTLIQGEYAMTVLLPPDAIVIEEVTASAYAASGEPVNVSALARLGNDDLRTATVTVNGGDAPLLLARVVALVRVTPP